ncbi:MAG: dethiobiotin synthase [Thermodesulfobacteriota bacterium]
MSAEKCHRGIFIAGTDTGVGKTVVSSGLVRLARRYGIRCAGLKPVETGCIAKSGELFPEDGARLVEASEGEITLDECAPLRFSIPASPARAAALEGSQIYPSDLVEHVRAVAEKVELIVVEGAGGLMVPIDERTMMIHFIERLGFPVLLVARSRLGTINHTMLSLEALRNRGIGILGVVVSCTDATPGPEEGYSAGDLGRLASPVRVVTLPHLPPSESADPERIFVAMKGAWPEDFVMALLSHESTSLRV